MASLEIELREDQFLEFEKLGVGAFKPLRGFMTEKEFLSVCNEMHLPDGEIFTIPILLDVSEEVANLAKRVKRIKLLYASQVVGELFPESIFTFNKENFALKIFGVNEKSHPGVTFFYKQNDWYIGGAISYKACNNFARRPFEFTPHETKQKFQDLNWKTIVGFQTRNVPHRAHEYLQRIALEHVDGLFIQPLVGQKKAGDFTVEAILAGYQRLISDFYPPNTTMLGVLSTAMRYAGPREAVFHAIIRRNYGCTHFIVGRDHAGVGDYYGKYEAHNLINSLDPTKLGIKIMCLNGPFYCKKCGSIATEKTCKHFLSNPDLIEEISGTEIRKILQTGVAPNNHFFRAEILDAIKETQLFIK